MDEAPATKPKRSHHRKKPDPAGLLEKLPEDPVDALVEQVRRGDTNRVLQLLLWKQRFENPGFTVELHPADIRAFDECVAYLGITPTVHVIRPGGAPAREAFTTNRGQTVPAKPALPPKPYVVVQMTDDQGHTFVAIENNVADYERQQQAKAADQVRANARSIAGQLQAMANSGSFSTATINDAARALLLLADRP